MIHQFFIDKRPQNGLTYEEYFNQFEEKIKTTDTAALNEEDKKLFEYSKLNLHRTNRIHKSYKVSDELCELLKEIDEPQLWMAITEDWCGDSAQNLPYIAQFIKCNPKIDLRIVLRDANPDIMDLYLTHGKSRSIPKIVAFDQNGNELFQWGPRPKAAQQLVEDAKAAGKSKDEFIEELHLWYGKNRGKDIEEEFKEIVKLQLAD